MTMQAWRSNDDDGTPKPMTTDPTTDKLVDLRVAHLNMIQGVIGRMSGFSAGVKNFCVTISAAIIAVAFQKHVPMLVWAAIAVVLIFFVMDAYYLALEKRYRDLYEEVIGRPFTDAAQLSLKPPAPSISTTIKAARSPSVIGFYVLLLIGIVALLIVSNHVGPQQAEDAAVRDSGAAGTTKRADAARVAARPGLYRRENPDVPAQCARKHLLDGNANSSAHSGEPVRPE
jgi:hypothetical protein